MGLGAGTTPRGSRFSGGIIAVSTASRFFGGDRKGEIVFRIYVSFTYRINHSLTRSEIIRVLEKSGIRRPTTDANRIRRMFSAPSLVVSAWDDQKLIGLARSLTDYAYCCYLSDLAVDRDYQNKGVGSELVRRTQAIAGDEVSLVLIAAPEAMSYYPKLGFESASNAFFIKRKR